MIKKLTLENKNAIREIINKSACAYKGVIPVDCYHEPYMTEEELRSEMGEMTFFGWYEEGKLVGVMGFQPIRGVTLIRHAYVLPDYQKRGIGTRLLAHLRQITKTKHLFVGTWAGASWAIVFYKRYGFKPLPNKDELLNLYWKIPPRQIETSVVLGIEN